MEVTLLAMVDCQALMHVKLAVAGCVSIKLCSMTSG